MRFDKEATIESILNHSINDVAKRYTIERVSLSVYQVYDQEDNFCGMYKVQSGKFIKEISNW